jgi:Zn-dependent peptidase ImmA (M78 family)
MTTTTIQRSILTRLRSLSPRRGLTLDAASGIAERQAALLLEASGVIDGPVPISLLSDLPRIELATERHLPSSGMSYWTGDVWRLVANASEPSYRQRFSLAHEYKHVIDHPVRDLLYADHRSRERVADHFAACLLMPKRMVIRAWCAGEQDIAQLADLFAVSTQAMERRLVILGLLDHRRTGTYVCERGGAGLPRTRSLAIAGIVPTAGGPV